MEKYIYSSEMFRLVDREFNLTKHYMSRDLDFLQRKYSFSRLIASINSIKIGSL